MMLKEILGHVFETDFSVWTLQPVKREPLEVG